MRNPVQKFKPQSRIQISSRSKKPQSVTNPPRSETTSNNSNLFSKLPTSKLESLSKNLLSKLDDIFIDYNNKDNLFPESQSQSSYSTKLQSDLTKTQNEPIPIPLSSHNPKPKSGHNPLPQVKPRKSYKGPPSKHRKDMDAFMTGVGLTKQPKKNKKQQHQQRNKFLAKTDQEIENMIANINDIDNMFGNSDISDDNGFEGSDEFKQRMQKEMADFKELIAEIDGYKQELHEEFDEIKYLIKFADNTHKLIDRHKNVIGSIFKGAGLKTRSELEQEDDNGNSKNVNKKRNNNINDDNDDYYNSNDEFNNSIEDIGGVFNKLKKINQIKDNLGNIQDNFLDYHHKFKEGLQRAQSAKTLSPSIEQI